ncbi:UNVERIFIED_CONTAM: hypothetical protein FKN15_061461 [Acipenser sinensis]
MVFESVVVDVLNRFLGDYVVNLDSSQLKLGIWGGDAVLRNLDIKENALSQLDIPFKVRSGHIGMKYDAEKEEKQLQEARQKELQRIEETKLKAEEREKPKEEKQDTFIEKLVTQVIKNLQVKISNIHIRYEDDITNPKSPLSFGVSLQNLSLQTADRNWNPCLPDETSKLFFKLVRLDNLFAYWNVNSELYSNDSSEEALGNLKNGVAMHNLIPEGYDFIFRPISAKAKLRMNPRSDVDFSSPKMDLDVNLQEVAIELNRPQYLSILELLGSVDMMSRNLPYRKFRPEVPVHSNAKLWWKYVTTCIFEVNVKPRHEMWSWKHIRRHRQKGNLKNGVAMHNLIPEGYDFIFRPISAKAKLRMNPRSDVDFSSPKMDLDVNLQEVAIELNRPQYLSILELLGSVDMMSRNLPYRKFRPEVPVHSNAKLWWKYVTTCIFEVNVKPRHEMWSWKHIRRHRQKVRTYKELYKMKITTKKPTEELFKLLQEPEKTLDIFNITLARQQAEMEASKAGLKIYRPGVKVEEEESGGWLGWMWSWSGEKQEDKETKSGGFDELMTPAEKAKLCKAIGYSETAVDPTLPKDVNFSSLDVHLHIEALLNAMNFLNNLIPPSEKDTSEESAPTVGEEKKEETTVAKKSSLVSQVIMRKNATEILAKLKNIVILDCDEDALYKKAVSIAGKEVFSFKMISHVDATEGNAYTDMNIVDSCVTLTVGCIQVIFVNKFVSSILDFINHFQTAKEALTEATVQAAGMAATGVMELAERSTRMALDIHVKAPVVVVPQSAVSKNVIVADFGLITVKNHFSIVQSKTHIYIPPVIDAMKVELSDLKLYRQEDLTVVLRTLNENIGDSSGAPAASATVDKSDNVSTKGSQTSEQNGGTTVITAAVVETQNITKLKTTLKLDFQFDSLTLELYSPNGTQGRDGTVLDTVVRDLILCASMEFLLTVADVFVKASQLSSAADQKKKLVTTATKEQAPLKPVAKMEMNVVVKNPEIVFVADLTRADAPALVVTTQCEVCIKNDPETQQMTAAIKDLKVVACPFLREMRKNNITTVLQPCDVFFQSSQTSSTPQKIELIIKCLTLKVSPIIINTVITITSALSPAAETPQELESPVPLNLWDKKQVKDLKLWFLEEDHENKNSTVSPLVPQGESLKMTIESIFLTLEAGVGHRTVPMLLAKSAFSCNVKNWSTLINLQSLLNLEVHYYNEVMGVWEPLLEPLDEETSDNFRPWTLGIKMKKKPVGYTAESNEVDYNVPDYKTVINISSKDQLNITLSKCALAFAEAASQTAECFQKDQAPFVIKNCLGIPVMVSHSDTFSVIGLDLGKKDYELQDGESLNMDYLRTMSEKDQFVAMTSMSSKRYYIQPTPFDHTSANRIPLTKVGRGLYSVIHKDSGVTRFIVCQIHTVEGSKVITIRSPFQIKNHFSIPFKVYEDEKLIGIALPQEEFCIPLPFYRSVLSLQPVTEDNKVYEKSEVFTYELISDQSGECLQRKCHRSSDQSLIINVVPVQDDLTCNSTEEKIDHPCIAHLWPTVLLRNLLPYPISYSLEVQLMVSDSELSDEFSLDTVGSYGDVKCKARNKDYLVGVKIDASSFSLTRIVTFIPFYMLVNRTNHQIEVSEEGKDKWTVTDSNQSVPFWPEKGYAKLLIKVQGCQTPPQAIHFNRQENCNLLHLDYKFGGIVVDVNLTEHSTIIRFSDYHEGSAPFLIINHTKETLEYHQSYAKEKDELQPSKAMYYTWVDPTGSRLLSWTCGKHTGELSPVQDKFLEINSDDPKLYLASFYEGLQRVALFTEDESVYKLLCESEKAELAEQEIILSLQNMGISLVNNCSNQEVSFIGITSSDIVWEAKPKHKSRWKPMRVNQTDLLESAFREYIDSGPVDNLIVNLDPNFQVCLTPTATDMKMLLPHEAAIRRNFLPAVKVEHNISARQKSYRVQIYRIQDISSKNEPKPLADVSIVTRSAGHSDISRIKYFKVLIQEMGLKLDLGFLYALSELFTQDNADEASTEQKVELFEKDIEYLKTELNTVSTTDTSAIGLYEYFHISPIKLHLSLSLSTGGEDGNKERRQTEVIPVQSLNLLLKSIGATLTDAQDVVFKLAFFELTYQFCTTQQLQWEVIRHYSKQAIKQMYVLVLGLDVLGNPFGLIRGLSEGFEAFFYEPYQGAIQGPEEFAEGMALGVKALVGGAVGGLAGAASRITGAMAKGIAAMTLDEEYQQKRREEMNTQPSGLREGITRGGKGLVSGFVSGITGIVTKPIKGAQKEGAAGFFKGVGKGLVGAVTRPTGGIIDMASSTFQGIKRATESSEGVESLRPPRFIHEDGVIRPYREREGVGSQMLQKRMAYTEWIRTDSDDDDDDS